MASAKKSEIVAYIPVIHRGYLELFESFPDAGIGVLSRDVLSEFDDLRKDIRAIEPDQAVELLHGYYPERSVRALGRLALRELSMNLDTTLILPDDEVGRSLASSYFGDQDVELQPVFLRWDRTNLTIDQEVEADRTVKPTKRQLEILNAIFMEGERSSNIWRGVGAAIVTTSNELFVARNRHLPTDYTPWIDGDPRSNLNRGSGIEVTTDQHAEAILIAESARKGVALNDAEIYAGTFPCPLCAKQIASAGIRTCFFVNGYASLDGQTVLKDAGVELIRLEYQPLDVDTRKLRPYPKSNSV